MDGTRNHHVKWDKPDWERLVSYFVFYVESRLKRKSIDDTSAKWG
jgi:hypothetical protein